MDVSGIVGTGHIHWGIGTVNNEFPGRHNTLATLRARAQAFTRRTDDFPDRHLEYF